MSYKQTPNPAAGSQIGKPTLPPMAKDMATNPALIAFVGAFGLVVIAAIIATIMGIAEQAREANASQSKN